MQHLWPFRVAFHYALSLFVELRCKSDVQGELYFQAQAKRLLDGDKISLKPLSWGPNPYTGDMKREFSFVFQQMFRRTASYEELDALFTPEWRDEF